MSGREGVSRRAAIACGLALLVGVTGCGGFGGSAGGGPGDGQALTIDGEQIASAELMAKARVQGALNLYHIYPEAPWSEVIDQFTEDTGIPVNLTRATTGQLFARIESEAAAGKLGADLMDFGDPILVQALADKGTIQRFEAPNAAAIPEDLRDQSGFSQVTELTPQIVAYNSQLVPAAEAPKGFADLLDPRWAGKISMTPIVTGGSSFTVAALQRTALGPEYWKQLAAQQPQLQQSVVPLTEQLARGSNPVGITDLGLLTTRVDAGAPLVPVFPEEGVPAFPVSSTISATTERLDAALVYEAWMASKRGGSVIADKMTAYPSNPDSALPAELPADQRDKLYVLTLADWTEHREAWTEEWSATFGYST